MTSAVDAKFNSRTIFIRLCAFSGAIMILTHEIFISASYALLDEWIYSFESIILGLAILISPFACFAGINFGLKNFSKNHPNGWWILIMTTILWRILTTLNHLNGPQYYDIFYMFITYFSVPFSIFIVSIITTELSKEILDNKQLIIFPIAFIFSLSVSIVLQRFAFYYAISGLFVLFSLFSHDKLISEKESKLNELKLILGDNVNLNGLICLCTLCSIFIGFNFWRTADIFI